MTLEQGEYESDAGAFLILKPANPESTQVYIDWEQGRVTLSLGAHTVCEVVPRRRHDELGAEQLADIRELVGGVVDGSFSETIFSFRGRAAKAVGVIGDGRVLKVTRVLRPLEAPFARERQVRQYAPYA